MVTGTQLKTIRSALGESQAAFAARLFVHQSTLHRWETEGVSQRPHIQWALERLLAGIDPIVAARELIQ